MPDRLSADALAMLATMTVVPPELRRACNIVRDEVGPYRAIVEEQWQAFAHACGIRQNQSDRVGRSIFVGSNVGWLFGQLDQFQLDQFSDEFACVIPAATLGRGAKAADPTLQLWQSGYTPVTVHRVPVDTGGAMIEVVAAVVRPTPPRP